MSTPNDDLLGNPNDGPSPNEFGGFRQEFKHHNVSARVPEKVVRGVYSTGTVVLQGPTEFVVDFLLNVAKPAQVVARVIIPPTVFGQTVEALKDNLQKYTDRFGPPPTLPKPAKPPVPPTIQEMYDDLKLADDLLPGAYCNAVMIGHSPAEFCMDFIANGFPRSVVAARVLVAAPTLPRVLETFSGSYQQYLKKQGE
ncbi:MAG TPA: DUF3467 domain-containing protein [Tepidisphaeraceae bacterium]|jgi:hypothetical protein|nr:DUF3467 domain-containing protein [Tepidisphaeraceae bacterium]